MNILRKKRKVYIVDTMSVQYSTMFLKKGWEITRKMGDADLVQFTGGADVTPSFYNQHPHARTFCQEKRDEYEKLAFLAALKQGKPMAGICRGGQFLNIMCGGSMWQEVEGHQGKHEAVYTTFRKQTKMEVTSTHHQMMIPRINDRKGYMILMLAHLNKRKQKCSPLKKQFKTITVDARTPDMEALHYKKENCLCFQPHPEFANQSALAKLYFYYVEALLLGKDK